MRSILVYGIGAVALAVIAVLARYDVRRLERKWPPAKLRIDVGYQKTRGLRWGATIGAVYCTIGFLGSLIGRVL